MTNFYVTNAGLGVLAAKFAECVKGMYVEYTNEDQRIFGGKATPQEYMEELKSKPDIGFARVPLLCPAKVDGSLLTFTAVVQDSDGIGAPILHNKTKFYAAALVSVESFSDLYKDKILGGSVFLENGEPKLIVKQENVGVLINLVMNIGGKNAG